MQKKLTPVLAILLVVAVIVAGVFGSQKGDLNDKIAALEAELNTSKGSVETLTSDLAAAQSALDAASAQGTELEANVAALTAQGETAAADLAAANTALEAANAALEVANADLTAKQAELDAAAAAKAELEAQVADLTAQNEAVKAELEAAKAELEAAKADLAAKQAELDAAAAKDAEQEANVAELTAKGEASAADLASAQAALEAANQGLATAKLDLEASFAKVAELEANVSALSAEEATTEADLSAAKTALEVANAELSAAKAALEAANTELETAKAALETANAELTAVKAELETAKADLAAAQAELEAAKAEVETLKAELEAAKAAAAVVPAEEPAPVEEPVAEAPAYDGPTSQAFLMFADGAWVNQVWNAGETPAGVTVTEATIAGEGDYTVGLAFETPAEGVAFTALGIADGEQNFPGWKIKINEIRVNGKAIEVGKGYTSSDEGIVTRMNIFNEWVSEIPADARSWDGNTADANWVIINKDDFASIESFEVDFSFIKYGIDTAYIMYADAAWAQQYWLDGNDYPVAEKNAVVTGAGDYTVGLDFTVTEAGKASGVAFAALGIKYGENLFPGMMIKINEVRVNGAAIEIGKGYTSSDDGIETRMNLMNEWVSELPADARSWDGSLEGATPIVIAKDLLAEVKTIDIDFTLVPKSDNAFLMFADSSWAVSAWNPGEYAETNNVKIEGPGTYTVKVDFAEPVAGFAFLAAGVAKGELNFPGYFMDITEIKVNGAAIEIAKDFTTTDEGVTTRSNIWNEWVTELPAQARVADGNLEGATAMIAAAEALSNVTSLEVTFDYIYGEPPAAAGPEPLTEEQVAEMIAKDYNGYIAVQSENYVFRNDWEEPSYGLNADNDAHTKLALIESDGSITDKGATFVDAVITGNGTYTATMTVGEPGFGTDTFFRYFRVGTDIPAQLVKEGYVTISDVTVKIGDAKTQEGLTVWTDGDWVKLVVVDEYNHIEAPFGYTVPAPGTTVTFTFTVSGLAD